MKKQIRLLTAAALCANLAFAGAAPGFAAEAAAPAAETESALQAGQELAGEVHWMRRMRPGSFPGRWSLETGFSL